MSFSFNHRGDLVKVSLGDVFKSTRTLREERETLIRKREELAKKKPKEVKVVPPKQQQQQQKQNQGNNNNNNNNNKNNKNKGNNDNNKDNNNKDVNMNNNNNKNTGNNEGNKKNNNNKESEKQVHVVPPKPNEFTDPPWFNPNRQNSSWTDADDATLLRMVGSNFPWPMIAAGLGRQVNEVESRWNQIRPDRAANNGKGDQQKAGGKQDKSDAKKGGTKADNASSKNTNSVIDNLTVEEAVMLKTLASKFEDDKWLRISSRFYDKTGKRISAQDVKKHVEQNQT